MAIVHRLPRPLWRLFSPVPNVVVVKVNGYEVGPGVILVNADLREANLEGVNLRKSVLSGATLAGADLRNADLSSVDLVGADLSTATLRCACCPTLFAHFRQRATTVPPVGLAF